jgi:hypothetical protein
MGEPWTEQQLDEALAGLHADVSTDQGALDRARAALRAEAAAVPAGARDRFESVSGDAGPAGRTGRQFTPWLVAAAVVLVIGLVVAVLRLIDHSGEPPAAPINKPPSVNSLDELARRCSDRPIHPGQYRYVHYWRDGGSNGFNPEMELWIPFDVSDEWLVRGNTMTDREVKEFRGPYGGGYLPHEGNVRAPTPDFYAELPRDPRRLHEQLRAIPVDSHPEYAMLRFSNNILPAPADLRAALLRAMSYDPDIVITNNMHTADRRSAVAVGYTWMNGLSREQSRVYIDPENCDVIGSKELETTGQYAVVDAIGERP